MYPENSAVLLSVIRQLPEYHLKTENEYQSVAAASAYVYGLHQLSVSPGNHQNNMVKCLSISLRPDITFKQLTFLCCKVLEIK